MRAIQDHLASLGPSFIPSTTSLLPPKEICSPVLGAFTPPATVSVPCQCVPPSSYQCACLCLMAASPCVCAIRCPHADSEGLGNGSRDAGDAPPACLRGYGDKKRWHPGKCADAGHGLQYLSRRQRETAGEPPGLQVTRAQ